MIIARTEDLSRTEFAAFNHGREYPRMRRWELPFALFSLRLPNTCAVLDCTINPLDFGARLQSLYPHALYRHCSPIVRGQFSPPLGVPDEAFDRVVCVNTLEHLLSEQREALVASLARKLKPGGLLIFTSDFYFDSMWHNEAALGAGVVRADGVEIFNGWNRVSPREYVELFRRHGLRLLAGGGADEEPREGDPTLYLNARPYEHACVAGVFRKSAKSPRFGDAKRVVLALLTWNTRDISLESLAAYAAEAAMLRRLGHEPFIVVCDNGSNDGTPEALREAERALDVPCALILNPENRGSSVARNQIIDLAVRECDADYLLFMDGDIELVPFSSFAMLRHMENHGHRLGCAGANSFEHTTERARAAPFLFTLDGLYLETTNLVAWTQYGMFRREVFESGVRFDEREPFDRPGWGFEDNDLAFQMDVKGYVNHRFFGMVYLHRAAHSSIRILHREGVDAASLYAQRRQYLLDKWSSVPQINDGPLINVRQVRMPDIRPQA
jgi:GT2 family glycosyltransferase